MARRARGATPDMMPMVTPALVLRTPLLPPAVLAVTSFDTDAYMRGALDAGATQALLLLGGSATNDAGAGMLQALGARLLDQHGQPLPPGGAALQQLATLDLSTLDPKLASLDVTAAVDATEGLSGAQLRELAVLIVQQAILRGAVDADGRALPTRDDVDSAVVQLLGRRKASPIGFNVVREQATR